MARISDRLLIQRVEDHIVILDEHAGTEIVFPLEQLPIVLRVLAYLGTGVPQEQTP